MTENEAINKLKQHFEDECVSKGFTLKSVIEARDKQIVNRDNKGRR